MKKAISTIFLLLMVFTSAKGRSGAFELDLSKVQYAIHTPDNDIDVSDNLKGSKTIIPEKVKAVITNVIDYYEKSAAKATKVSKGEEAFKCFYGPVFYIKSLNYLDLYVLRVFETPGLTVYLPILYNPATGQITKDPPGINGSYMYEGCGLLKKPIVYFDSIDTSDKKDLVFQERTHNGTMYNAVVYNYFHINDDLSLTTDLALETRLKDIDDDGLVVRTIKVKRKNYLKILVTSEALDKKPIDIGYLELGRGTDEKPFTIKTEKVFDPKCDKRILVTGTESDDENKLIQGKEEYHF